MKIIRHKAFETNSSSTHSICVTETDLTIEDIEGCVNTDNGSVSVVFSPGEFGWEQEYYYHFQDKYVYVHQYIDNYKDAKNCLPNWIDSTDKLRNICKKCISNLTGIDMINISFDLSNLHDPETGNLIGYIDHQSLTDTLDDAFMSQKHLLSFLFNSESYLRTDNDNS